VDGGLIWFIKGPAVRLSLEFAHVINGANLNNKALHQVLLQGQISL
jgi:hypothetical protein